MTATLDLVYRYRTLMGKCDAGQGLGLDEIEEVITLEAMFNVDRDADTDLWACRRAHRRSKCDLAANLRNKKLGDTVRVVELGPGGLVCRATPYVEKGERIEILFDDAELGISYRFRAVVAWVDEDGEDYACGLELQGTPLLVRFGPQRRRADTRADSESELTATTKFQKVAA